MFFDMKTTNLVFLLLVVVAVLAAARGQDSTPVQQCGAEKLFKNVAIYTHLGLCTQLPCRIKMGSVITVVAEFENKNAYAADRITTECVARVLGKDHRLPIPDADKGCDYLVQGKCPVAPSYAVTLKRTLKVSSKMFDVSVDDDEEESRSIDAKMETRIRDQKGQVISCFRLTAKIS